MLSLHSGLSAGSSSAGVAGLSAGLSAGFSVVSYGETPRPTIPQDPLPEPTREISDWRLWPWTLLGFDPAATRAAWNNPAIAVWHFRGAR